MLSLALSGQRLVSLKIEWPELPHSMRLRRRLPVIVVVLLVVAAVGLVVFLRKHAPPEPARLLPGADAFVYVNLQWMRRANLAPLDDVPHETEYQKFLQETGFQFERDLDEAAFAIHYPSSLSADKSANQQPRFSEVFVGKFQAERLTAYLRKISSSVDDYQSINIYNIPIEGRIFRVAILGVDSVAASNHSDPLVIRGIIDRSRKLASPFGGPALLRKYYKQVPLASVAWGIFRVEPAANAASSRGFGLSFLFSKPAAVVASARYLGSVHFKAEAFTATDDDAKLLTERVGTFLSVFHSAETSVGGQQNDPDLRQFLDSLKVEQHGDRAVLSASVPTGLLHKMVAESPAELVPKEPEPSTPPAPPKSPQKGRKPERTGPSKR